MLIMDEALLGTGRPLGIELSMIRDRMLISDEMLLRTGAY